MFNLENSDEKSPCEFVGVRTEFGSAEADEEVCVLASGGGWVDCVKFINLSEVLDVMSLCIIFFINGWFFLQKKVGLRSRVPFKYEKVQFYRLCGF